MTDISSSIQFLDKEIRKLWDLSNKRNKVNIQKLSKQTGEIERLLSVIESDINTNQDKLILLQNNIKSNISKIDELGLSSKDLGDLKLSLSNINTQQMLLDDSVQALNSYKNQLNQAILEIQTEISNLQNSINDNMIENE